MKLKKLTLVKERLIHEIVLFLMLVFFPDDDNNQRKTWNTPQKRFVKNIFGQHIISGTYPSGREMLDVIKNNALLMNRTVSSIRS